MMGKLVVVVDVVVVVSVASGVTMGGRVLIMGGVVEVVDSGPGMIGGVGWGGRMPPGTHPTSGIAG